MKTITTDYKNQLKKMGKELDNIITYSLNNTAITLTNEDISNVSYHYEGNILKSTMKQLDFECFNEIPTETELNYKFGLKVNNSYEYIDYGTFIVYSCDKLEDTDTYKIVCYDKMLYSMKDYESLDVNYPISIRNYINALCTKIGLTFKNANDTFANYDKEIQQELYLDSDNNSLGYTYRDVLDELAQATASTICINDNDELEVRYIEDVVNETQEANGTDLTLTDSQEGQIKGIEVEGNTTQDGTPSPTNPINIDVVSGLQNIDIVGKNYFNKEMSPAAGQGSIGNISVSQLSTGLRFTYTNNTSYTYQHIDYPVMDLTNYVGKTIRFKANWSASASNNCRYYIGLCNSDGSNRTVKSDITTSGGLASFVVPTLTGNQTYLCVAFYINNTGTIAKNDYADFTDIICTINNENMTYEPYKSQSYDINLGKNLFDKDNLTSGFINTSNGSITTNANWQQSDYIKIIPSEKYTISNSISMAGAGYFEISKYDENKSWLSSTQYGTSGSKTYTYTNDSNTYYIKLGVYKLGTSTDNIQLEKGSQATSYSEYFNPIELCKIGNYQDKIYKGKGINLFDKDSVVLGKVWNGASNTKRAYGYIEAKQGQVYTARTDDKDSDLKIYITETAVVGTGGNHIKQTELTSTLTFTPLSQTKYIVVQYSTTTNDITQTMIDNSLVQIEYGNQVSDYEPYNAKDKWLLHKEIGKVVLDGNTNWQNTDTQNLTNTMYFGTNVIEQLINTSVSNLFSNYFEVKSLWNNDVEGIQVSSSVNHIRLRISNTLVSNVATFKTWLSTHNTIVYYVLKNPTTEEITNSELLSQLKALEKAKTYEGITNILSSFPISFNYVSEYEIIDEEYIKNTRAEFSEKYGPINSIVFSRASDSDNVYIQDEDSIEANGLCELKIRDNQILAFNDRADYLEDILDRLDGLEYYTNDFESIGITYLDLCDRYRIKVRDNTYKCIMLNDEIEVNNGLNEIIYTDLPTENKTDYNTASKDDRTKTRAEIIVDKQQGQINSLVEKVVDISNTISGTGSITLENAHEGNLHYLSIKGNISQLFPKSTTLPSNSTYPIGPTLLIDDDTYTLDIDRLRYVNNTLCDEFIYEDGNCYIIRRLDNNGNQLQEEVIEDREGIILNVKENSSISLKNFNNAILKCEYLLENVYTDNFASQVDVKSEIIQTENMIQQKVSSVSDENGNVTSGSIILAINKDESQAVINADKISLEGKEINLTSEDITINSDNFKVDNEGRVEAKELTTGNNVYIGSQDDYGIKRIQFTDDMYINRYVSPIMEIMQLIAPLAINVRAGSGYLSVLNDQVGISLDDGSSYVATFRSDSINFAYQPIIGSDIRLKDNINDVDVSFIDDLDVKEYEYKTDHKKHIGLIAQDYLDKEYSKYFLDKDENDYYGIRYNDITNALIKYCQELKQRLDKQEKEIKLLKENYSYADMVIIKNYLLGKIEIEESDKKHYDLNKDGIIDILDVALLRKKLLINDKEEK